MLDPYKHEMLHKYDQRERLKAAEHMRLLKSLHHANGHMQFVVHLSGFIKQWWDARWRETAQKEGTQAPAALPEG